MVKAFWPIAFLCLLTAAAFAQEGDKAKQDDKADQEAIKALMRQVLADEDQQESTPPPEAREEPPKAVAIKAVPPAPPPEIESTEMNLSGADVGISVVGSDLVITANEHDMAILQELIKRLDEEMPSKELRVVSLQNRPAAEVGRTLQESLRELYVVGKREELPEERVTVTAVSSNILLIVAPGPKMEQVVTIVEAIDAVPPELQTDFMVFTLKNRKASEAKIRVEEIIEKLQQRQGAQQGEQITVEANDANNTLIVFGPLSMQDRIQQLLDQIDAESVPGYGELKLVVFPLLNADANDLVRMFEEMLAAAEAREGVQETIRRLIMLKRVKGQEPIELPPLDLEKTLRMIADEGSNSVIVATVEENIDPVGEIIGLLDDVPLSVEMGIRVYPLQFADAESVRNAVEEMFDKGKELPKAAERGKDIDGAVPTTPEGEALVYKVGLVADLRTNTLFASGRPVQLTLIERIVQEMDQPATALKFPLRLLFLGENLDATRVGQILEDLWEKRIEALEAQDAGNAAVERERVFLAIDLRSNALIVSASEENYAEITQIVQKLDTAPDRLIDQIRIINCNNTSAGDLASKIEDLWQRKADLRREGDIPEDLPVIVADQRSNSLVIASSPEDFAEITRLIDKLESQPLAPIAGIRLIALKNNDASEISQMFEQLFEERMQQRLASGQDENPSDRVALAYDAPTNTILVASSQENYEEMVRIAEILDAEPDIEGVVQTFVLEFAEATPVSEKIKELFDQGLYNPTTGLDSQLTEERMKIAIVADTRANAIMSIVGRLIEQMDAKEPPLQENTRLFQLRYADAVKLTDMLERLFEGMRQNAPDPDIFTEPTIIPDDRSNMLIVSGSRDALQRTDDLIAQLDREAGPPTSIFQVYALEFASAVKLAAVMQDMFDKRSEGVSDERTPINIFADETSNMLICSAAREDQAVIESLLKLLDKPSTIARQFKIFPLRRAKAEPLADRLDELFQSQAEGAASGARAHAIAVQPDARTNSLIVWASPTEMENIETIVNRLDTAQPAMEMGIRVVQLKQALAEDLAQVLQDSLIGERGGAGTDSEAVIVSYMALKDDGTREQRKLLRQDLTITPDQRTNTLTVMAPADSMDMLEALIRDFDKIRPQLAVVQLFPLVNADAEEVVQRLETLFEEQAGEDVQQQLTFGGEGGAITVGVGGETGVRQQLRFAADRRTNTVIAAGAEVDLAMVEELIYALDARSPDDRVQLVYEVKNTTAEALTEAIRQFAEAEQERLRELEDEASALQLVERYVTAIPDEQSNSVVLGVSPRYYDQYMSMIQELDRPPPQVMIQVLIAEVTLDNRLDLGIEFAEQDLLFTSNAVAGPNGTVEGSNFDFVLGTDLGAGAGALGGFNFTITGEDFSFLLRALESDSRLEVLSRPTIMVENNETANITIGDRVPIVQGSTFTDAGNTSTQVSYENVGIILDVTPHINPDGYVNLEIHPEISQVSTSSVQLTEGLQAPIFSERSAETVITVKDGETVVIGGLITNAETDSETKVPIIGDIPGLGVLFRTTSHQVRKTELLMVLTVTVLRNEADTRAMSVAQRDKTGLLENISRNPLMEGLRIRAEDHLAPKETGKDDEEPQVRPDRDIYGPTPDVYGPPSEPTRVERPSFSNDPVARVYGPPMPRPMVGGGVSDMRGARLAASRLASTAPQSP